VVADGHESRRAKLLTEQRLERRVPRTDRVWVFPFATYGARVHLNAPCELEPKDTAFVTKPGPLLSDVMNDLGDQRQLRSSDQREARHTDSIDLIEKARAAFGDESDEVIEHDAQLFDDKTRISPSRQVMHRFAKRDNATATAPRRIVTLRDARRGRPKRPSRKHGADPPV